MRKVNLRVHNEIKTPRRNYRGVFVVLVKVVKICYNMGMTEIKTHLDVFEKLNMYEPIKIEFATLVEKDAWRLNFDNFERLQSLLIAPKKIQTKCIECGMIFPFTGMDIIVGCDEQWEYIGQLTIELLDGGRRSHTLYPYREASVLAPFKENSFEFKSRVMFLEYRYRCTNDNSHYYRMILRCEFVAGCAIIAKVGQFPLNTMLQENNSNIYKKQLDVFGAFEDYRKSLQSSSRGLHAGSCTYLRRVFEKMVNHYLADKTIKDTKMETKIKAIKKELDPDIADISKPQYGLLSKGIHELEEKEIKEMYPLLKEFIDIQLDFEKTKQDSIERKQKLKVGTDIKVKEHSS